MNDFQKEILAGIPEQLPEVKEYDKNINHAPLFTELKYS